MSLSFLRIEKIGRIEVPSENVRFITLIYKKKLSWTNFYLKHTYKIHTVLKKSFFESLDLLELDKIAKTMTIALNF